MEFLFSKGANINFRDYHRYSPLHYAASKSPTHIITLLLMIGANINITNHL